MLTIDGLITGIDTSSIIEGLLSIQQRQIDSLRVRQQDILDQQTAFKGIEAHLLTLQSSISQLGRSVNNIFRINTTSVNHEDLVAAAATDDAVPGVHTFRVDSLARAEQIATQGFASPDSLITQGTLDIQLGIGPTSAVTIDGSNNTLQGLVDAINHSAAEVTATIINDGSSGTPYRLMLSGDKTGAANTINITNNLAASSGNAIKPIFSGTATTPSTIASAAADVNYGAATTPISNSGAGNYTGPDNDTYTFTFIESGIIGDKNVKIAYSDGSGDNSGTIDYKTGHAGSFRNVAEGLQLKFDPGGVAVAGKSFTIDVSTVDGSVADAVKGAGYDDVDVAVSSNEGTGEYTGPDNDTYTFTLTQSKVVGREDIQIAYTDGSGDNSGTLTYDKDDVGTFVTVAEGVKIKLEAGLAMAGNSFTVDVSSTDTSIAAPVTGSGYGADAHAASNAGNSEYSGPDDDTYSFTVTQGGIVGEDTIQISYQDGSGDNSGTFTINAADVDVFKDVAEGLKISLAAGLVKTGDTFSVDVTAGTQTTVDPVQQASDAAITIGTGPGAITIHNATNQVEDLIPGVTLDLLSADSNREVAVTVSSDTETARTAITDFVDGFNGVMEFVDQQVRYDAETEAASALLGNRSVISIQDDVRRAVTEVVAGVSSQMNRLSAIGITFTDNGRLTVNSSKLDQALQGQVDGVTLDDVRRLFALAGQSDNGNVQFVLGSDKTKDSATPYEVDIVQAAERASITAANALTVSTVINSSNNTLTLTIDGKSSSTLVLADGTYTRQQLADHLQSVINADSELTGRSASVTLATDALQVTSDVYGSSSEVTIGSGSVLADLGFAGSETDTGQNVAGFFLVDGQTETATGSGRLLIADASNANTSGLQVRVTMTPSQIQVGADANLTVTRGLASRLEQVLGNMLDPISGRVKTVNDGFGDRIEGLEGSIERLNESFQAQQESLVRQFAALESAVSQIRSTGDFLVGQLASINNLQAQ